jgi:hypothetical protein
MTKSGQLNVLDGFARDGDLGLTITTACTAVEAILPEVENAPVSESCAV